MIKLSWFAIQPMTPERVERMHPPIGICQICRQPNSSKITYSGLLGIVSMFTRPPRYACPDHIQETVTDMAEKA